MREGWQQIRLGDVFEPDNSRLGEQTEEPTIFSVSKYDGVVPADSFFGKRIASAQLHTYKVLPVDGWAYSTIHIDEGSIARNKLNHGGVVSPMYTTLRWKGTSHNPQLFEWLLRGPAMLETYRANAQGSINRRRSLPWKAFSAIEIGLPSLAEQKRIVDLIGALDEAIEAASGALAAERETYDAALDSLVSGPYPKEQVSSVVHKAKAGGTPSRAQSENFGGDVPWLKSGEVNDDSISVSSEFITESALKSSSAWLAPAGSTVVAMYGQGDTKGTAGYLSQPMAMNQAVIALVADETKVMSRYLFHSMRSRTTNLRSRAIGAAQPNLSKDIVVTESISVPTLPKQKQLTAAFDALLDGQREKIGLLNALKRLRTNLLAVCLSGKHEIPSSYDEAMGVSA
jgi:type I restriction enzyme S subunit